MTVRLNWPAIPAVGRGRVSLKSALLIADSVGRDDQELRDMVCFCNLDLGRLLFAGCCCGHPIVRRLWDPIQQLPGGGVSCEG